MDLSSEFQQLVNQSVMRIVLIDSYGMPESMASAFSMLEDCQQLLDTITLVMGTESYALSMVEFEGRTKLFRIVYGLGNEDQVVYLSVGELRRIYKELDSLEKDMGRPNAVHRVLHWIDRGLEDAERIEQETRDKHEIHTIQVRKSGECE